MSVQGEVILYLKRKRAAHPDMFWFFTSRINMVATLFVDLD